MKVSNVAKGGGGKLNKSETVQVRFDPILKMAADLAAAQDRRTLSSFTEMAVDRMVRQVQVARDKEGNPVDAYQVARECWQADPRARLQLLANHYPDLLTIRERKIMEAWEWVPIIVKNVIGVTTQEGVAFVGSFVSIEAWDDMCLYADDQISLEDMLRRLHNIIENMEKEGRIITHKKADEGGTIS